MRMLAIAKGLIDRFGPNKFVIVQDRSGWFYVGIAGGNVKRISPRFESQKDVHVESAIHDIIGAVDTLKYYATQDVDLIVKNLPVLSNATKELVEFANKHFDFIGDKSWS